MLEPQKPLTCGSGIVHIWIEKKSAQRRGWPLLSGKSLHRRPDIEIKMSRVDGE